MEAPPFGVAGVGGGQNRNAESIKDVVWRLGRFFGLFGSTGGVFQIITTVFFQSFRTRTSHLTMRINLHLANTFLFSSL